MLTFEDRAAAMGDTANIDFDGFSTASVSTAARQRDYDLELGSNSFVPGFEDQIVGMKVGEEKDIDITFPENYVEDLAGKAVVFKVKQQPHHSRGFLSWTMSLPRCFRV